MAINTSAQFSADVARVIAEETLEVAQRYLVVYQFADKKTMEKGAGLVWTATRFSRLPLPLGPLSEGVAPTGQTLGIQQVQGVALQWGDKITFTDVSIVATQHDLLHIASERLGMQLAELKERNGINILMGATQVNYVGSRGSRAALTSADVMDPTTVSRTAVNLKRLGAPLWLGQRGEDVQRSIEHNARASEKAPLTHEHYVAVMDPLVANDLANNATVVQAWSYSDVHRLYINEIGYWRGIHFCESNLLPNWVGIAAIQGTAGTSGSLATGTYYVQVTGWDTQNQYESQIYQVSASIAVTGPNGSISVTVPSTAGFTYAVYVGTSASPSNLGLSTSGPTTGPYQGQAILIAAGTTATITGVGLFQVPPAAPATGITVFSTFVFGQRAFCALKLEDVTWTRLFDADKSDQLNQLRVVGYKYFEGWTILNNQFLARIESTAASTGTFG